MPKSSKSSATSATRKKHARKAGEPEIPPQNTKTKPSKKEIKKGLVPPPKKTYTPPSKLKPAPVDIDPLDSSGLAAVLPADLVVVLRKLAKKDVVTKTRALDELGVWISNSRGGHEDSETGVARVSVDVLVSILPIWSYRYPALSVHPSRRIRHLSSSVHASLLEILTLRESLLASLASDSQSSQLLGTWCLSAWDVDRGVSAISNRSWRETFIVPPEEGTSESKHNVLDDSILAKTILPFIVATIMEPESTFASLNPSYSKFSGNTPSPNQSLAGIPRKGEPPPATPPGYKGRNILRDGPPSSTHSSPSRGEDAAESAEDRNARLRVGAMGVLKWIFDAYTPTEPLVSELRWLVSSSQFWTVLHHAIQPPFLQEHRQSEASSSTSEAPLPAFGVFDGFGYGQTIVRRAGWGIVHSLLGGRSGKEAGLRWIDSLSEENSRFLSLMSSAVLRSAFVESDAVVRSSMWGPLLIFLKKIENSWLLNVDFEDGRRMSGRTQEEEDESDIPITQGDRDSIVQNDPSSANTAPATVTSAAYGEFLSFLALGCNGSPIQGYPTVLVILSTIPDEILPATFPTLVEYFDALWAAIDGQALSSLATERAKGTEAFLGAWGECLCQACVKLVKNVDLSLSLDSPHGPRGSLGSTKRDTLASTANDLVRGQFARLVENLGKSLRVSSNISGRKVARILENLEQVSPVLVEEAWTRISELASSPVVRPEDKVQKDYIPPFLAALREQLPSESLSKRKVDRLVVTIAMGIVARNDEEQQYEAAVEGNVLEKLIDNFGQVLEADSDLVKHIDKLFETSLASLLAQPSLILSYLDHRSDVSHTVETWRRLLSILGTAADIDLAVRLQALSAFVNSVDIESAQKWAKPLGGELDGVAGHILNEALDGDPLMLDIMKKLLEKADPFLHIVATKNLISSIMNTLHSHALRLIRDQSAPLQKLRSALDLLIDLRRYSTSGFPASSVFSDAISCVFLLAFILPQCSPTDEELVLLNQSKRVWETWNGWADEDVRRAVSEKVIDTLKELILDTDVRPRPSHVLHAYHHIPFAKPIIISRILPVWSGLEALLASTSADPIDNALAVTGPLVPFSPGVRASRKILDRKFDVAGFSSYARAVSCLLHVMTSDRQFARENMWALHHAIILAQFATEALQIPGEDSSVFRLSGKEEHDLREILRKTQHISTFLLISTTEDTWHKETVKVLVERSSRPDGLDSVGSFVSQVFETSVKSGSARDSLVLRTVLQYILRSATRDDADLWIDLARNLRDEDIQTSLAVLSSVTELFPESPKLDRYRNELASRISGVSPAKANGTGLASLRRLSAVAPSPESDVIFLPQQRAVYLMQSFQAWIASDEDISENVEIEVSSILFHLAPILQNVQGAHWDFIMDMLENNLENSSFEDTTTLVLLSRSLRLLSSIQDLSVSNKHLRELWNERSKPILTLVHELLARKTDHTSLFAPRTVCREQALSVIQNLPSSFMSETTLSRMCHLLTDPSADVQKMTYQLLQQAAVKRTEHLVIQAGVDPDTTTIELPPELIMLIQSSSGFEVGAVESHTDALGFLFGWMIMFDLFTNTSLKVRTAYIDQMRNLNIIEIFFLPHIFELLGVGTEGQKPFRLDIWSVDEFWTTFFDASISQSLQLLAGHLYYRGLLTIPSLIRSWWDELKDRQLLAAVTSFTSSHFSPVLVASELIHVKPSSTSPTTGEEPLVDESFNVKVALAVSEVTATYKVDDQYMEVGVRVPKEYPLRAVEVRDIRRVGVPEKLWRKWLFAMQQVVTSQNGRIVDALSLFKKNVSLHFEGQVECAICYSIISVSDRSLPSKPCKTCKNRFHSGCLYKWFSTSHSSSCPLCRSDIM